MTVIILCLNICGLHQTDLTLVDACLFAHVANGTLLFVRRFRLVIFLLIFCTLLGKCIVVQLACDQSGRCCVWLRSCKRTVASNEAISIVLHEKQLLSHFCPHHKYLFNSSM